MPAPPPGDDPADREVVLAFDADCRRCRTVAAAVAARAPELTVLPLRDYRVRAWRAEALGDDAPWAPTFLVVTPGVDGTDRVRARTGLRGVARGLVGTLGARRAAMLAPALAGLVRRPSPGRGA